jgi:hypothetical protein
LPPLSIVGNPNSSGGNQPQEPMNASQTKAILNYTAADIAAGTFPGAMIFAAGTNFTAQVNIDGSSSLCMVGAPGTNRPIAFYSTPTANGERWIVYATGDPEGGSNAGSNFAIGRYSDTGVFIENTLSINRASGLVNVSGAGGLNVVGPTSFQKPVTISGNLVVATSGSSISITGANAQWKPIYFNTSNINRWAIGANATNEGGSNAGSDFQILRYADASGGPIDAPLTITRSTGNVAINSLSVGTFAVSGSATVPTPSAFDTSQAVANMAMISQRGMTAGPLIVSTTDCYPNAGYTGKMIWMANPGTVFLPGDAGGSAGTYIIFNGSTGIVGIAGSGIPNLNPGEGVILIGNNAGSYYPVGMYAKAGPSGYAAKGNITSGGGVNSITNASVSRASVGVYNVTLNPGMANTTYIVQATCQGGGTSTHGILVNISSPTAFQVVTSINGAASDCAFSFIVFA